MTSPPVPAGARESRERRTMHLPPLRAPRERASLLFGIAGGCLPMLVGFGAWLLFWFGGPEPPTGWRRWGTLAFSAVLVLMGLRFAMETFLPPRGGRGAAEPWGEGYPWRRDMPPYDAGTGAAKVVVAFLGLLLFLVVINFPLFDPDFTDLLGWGLILFFDAFLLFVLGVVLLRGIERLSTGPVWLELATYPAAPGGLLRAALVSRRPLRLQGPVTATLSGVEEVGPPGPVRDPDRSGQPEAFYTQERTVELAARRTHRVELELALPADLPGTRLRSDGGPRRYWVLELALPLPGPDGQYFFLLPVYDVTSTGAPPPESSEGV